MADEGSPWGTWVPSSVVDEKAGVPTDDSCYRLFILHEWLKGMLEGADFSEASFRAFLHDLQSLQTGPSWIEHPRNEQIAAWLSMYQAEENNEVAEFFQPGVPTVFGPFMFLELVAVRRGPTPLESFHHYSRFATLDQGYAKTATGFYAALMHCCFDAEPGLQPFGYWLIEEAKSLLQTLMEDKRTPQPDDVRTLHNLIQVMEDVGREGRTLGEREFVERLQQVAVSDPPFLPGGYIREDFDPFRFIAEMVGNLVFAPDDPITAIRHLACSPGDSDTMASFLGSLVGAYYGVSNMSAICSEGVDVLQQLSLVEACLADIFEIDIEQRVSMFAALNHKDVI